MTSPTCTREIPCGVCAFCITHRVGAAPVDVAPVAVKVIDPNAMSLADQVNTATQVTASVSITFETLQYALQSLERLPVAISLVDIQEDLRCAARLLLVAHGRLEAHRAQLQLVTPERVQAASRMLADLETAIEDTTKPPTVSNVIPFGPRAK